MLHPCGLHRCAGVDDVTIINVAFFCHNLIVISSHLSLHKALYAFEQHVYEAPIIECWFPPEGRHLRIAQRLQRSFRPRLVHWWADGVASLKPSCKCRGRCDCLKGREIAMGKRSNLRTPRRQGRMFEMEGIFSACRSSNLSTAYFSCIVMIRFVPCPWKVGQIVETRR
jgi:hypothetical protein